MLTLIPRPYNMCGDFVTAVTERPVWDVVLDDDSATEVANLVSKTTITVVTATETTTDTWTVVLSDDASTEVTDLTKTLPVGITSSTEDEGENSTIWDCTLKDGHEAIVLAPEADVAVGSFVYFLKGSPANSVPNAPTWLSMTAVEVTKWM